MTDYRELLPLLKAELAQIEQPEFHLSAEAILEALESDGPDSTDDVVREYAATLILPPVEDHIRFQIALRLRYAIAWIENLADASADPAESLPEFLTSTMIDAWRDDGRAVYCWNHFVNPDAPWA